MEALVRRQQELLALMDTGIDDAEQERVCKAIDEVEEAICDAIANELEAGTMTVKQAEKFLDNLGIDWN